MLLKSWPFSNLMFNVRVDHWKLFVLKCRKCETMFIALGLFLFVHFETHCQQSHIYNKGSVWQRFELDLDFREFLSANFAETLAPSPISAAIARSALPAPGSVKSLSESTNTDWDWDRDMAGSSKVYCKNNVFFCRSTAISCGQCPIPTWPDLVSIISCQVRATSVNPSK